MLVREVQVPTDGRHYVPTSPRGHSRHLQHHGLVRANITPWSGPVSRPSHGQRQGEHHTPIRANVTARSRPTSHSGHRTCQGDSSEPALSTRGISNLFLTREESAQVLLM